MSSPYNNMKQSYFTWFVWLMSSDLYISSVQFSRSVVSDSLWPQGLQHARPPCLSPTPRVYLNSYPLSRWCHPTISSCHPLFLPPSIFPSIRVFSNESALCIRWPKYNFSYTLFNYFMWKKEMQFLLFHLVSKSKYCGCFYFYIVLLFNAEFGE